MAQTGFTPLIHYNSGTTGHVPSSVNLVAGEIAINYFDGSIFYLDNTGTVQTFGGISQAAGVTGTGKNVLATSPSLTTPTITTPLIYFSYSSAVSAAGTTQGTATAVTSDFINVTTCAAGAGVTLPVTVAGREITIKNNGANALLVYPASGGAIDSNAANVAYSLPVGATEGFSYTSTINVQTMEGRQSNLNVPFSVVQRDASGNFSAGTITANLTGNASTSTTATSLTGTLSIANGGTGSTGGPSIYQNINRSAFLRETNGGTLVIGGNYSIYTGGGAITMYLPAGVNGDVIYITNLEYTWATNNFTITSANSNVYINQVANTSLVCDVNSGGFTLFCSLSDGTNSFWIVK